MIIPANRTPEADGLAPIETVAPVHPAERYRYDEVELTSAALRDLLERWRGLVGTWKAWGLYGDTTRVLERCITELEVAVRQQHDEPLTLAAAARESGYSENHLGRLIREGRIPNAGRLHAPAIRRGDLPRKPTARDATLAGPGRKREPVDRLFRDILDSKQRRRG